MTSKYDVVVIGLGAMGGAATYQLARRGQNVLGLDQFAAGHTNGSSHGAHRMIRRSSYRPEFAPLIDRAFELWRELETEADQSLLNIIGEVSLVDTSLPAAEDEPADLTIGGARAILSEQELAADFPGFRPGEQMVATYEAEAGFLWSETAVAAELALAVSHGAEIHREEEVLGWRPDGDGVSVETTQGVYLTDRLIITAGPWASELLPELGHLLQPTRIVNVYFQPTRPDWWSVEHGAPNVLLAVPEGQFYGIPAAGSLGFKLGRHDGGEPTTARTIRRSIDDAERESLRAVLDRYLVGASGPVLHELTCMYTLTPDETYVVERHPAFSQVAYGCGFSGTGFKFSCVMGEILADLAIDGATRFDLAMLSSSRFAAAREARLN